MPPKTTARITQFASLFGLLVSAWLLAEYGMPAAKSSCPLDGGCHAVRACNLLGMHGALSFLLPPLGMLTFLLALVLSLSDGKWLRKTFLTLAVPMGVTGIVLVIVQKTVCHAWCPYCLCVDVSAVILAGGAVVRQGGPAITRSGNLIFGALTLVGLGIIVTAATIRAKSPIVAVHTARLPATVSREQRAGVVTIIEFANLGCPQCRAQNPSLVNALEPYGARVRLVRHYPVLSRFRASPEGAGARAVICADEQGAGEQVANTLFAEASLSPSVVESAVSQAHVALEPWRQCLASERPDLRLDDELNAAQEVQLTGLPTLYVGHDVFEGEVVPTAILRESIDRELREAM